MQSTPIHLRKQFLRLVKTYFQKSNYRCSLTN
nr:MAG TPA: hypothetical protein [Caudoviricetes sp.]